MAENIMQEPLNASTLMALKNRFFDFHDARIHHVSIAPFAPKAQRNMTIIIGARDWSKKHENDNWYNITFDLNETLFYSIQRYENTFVGTVMSINIHFGKEEVFLDLFPVHSSISNPSDYYREHLSSAIFLVAARKCFFSISNYKAYSNE